MFSTPLDTTVSDLSPTALQAALERCCAAVIELEARLHAEREQLARLRALRDSERTPAAAFGFVLPAAS